MELDKIRASIASSAFISFDLEFTGIARKETTFFDEMEIRYLETKRSAESYAINQFGFTCWTLVEDTWQTEIFCYYVKPNAGTSFVSSIDSLEFLARNNFDYNKWIKEAIPYLDTIPKVFSDDVSEADKPYFQTVAAIIDAFILTDAQELIVDAPTPSHRRIAHIATRQTPSLSSKGGSGNVVVTKTAPIDYSNRGFKVVVDIIRASGVPVVGHNMGLDVAYTIHSFVAPLPSRLASYKTLVHSSFPMIYDTKSIISTAPSLQQYKIKTGLKDLFDYTSILSLPHINLPENQAEQFHDAGYDSFCTGFVFLKLIGLIQKSSLSDGVAANEKPQDMFKDIKADHLNVIHYAHSPSLKFAITEAQEISYASTFQIFSRDHLSIVKSSLFVVDVYRGNNCWYIVLVNHSLLDDFAMFLANSEIEFEVKKEYEEVREEGSLKRARVDYSDV